MNSVCGLRRIREKQNVGMAFSVQNVTDRVRTVRQRDEHVHGLLRVFVRANEKPGRTVEVQDSFVFASRAAASFQVAELIVIWSGILGRRSLAQNGSDKNHGAYFCIQQRSFLVRSL